MLLRWRRSAAFDCVECGACPTSGDSVNDFQQRQRRSNHLKCVAPPMAPVLQVRAAMKGGLRKARPGIGDVSQRHVLSQCTVALQRLVVHLRRFYGRSGAARPPLPVRSACEPGVARDDDHRKKSKKKTPTTAGRRAFFVVDAKFAAGHNSRGPVPSSRRSPPGHDGTGNKSGDEK